MSKPNHDSLDHERPWFSPEWSKLVGAELVAAKLLFPYLNGSKSTAANLAVELRKVFVPRKKTGRPQGGGTP